MVPDSSPGCLLIAALLVALGVGGVLGLAYFEQSSPPEVYDLFGSTPTPLPAGHTITVQVRRFPACGGVVYDVEVLLVELGQGAPVDPASGSGTFYAVPDGTYTLAVAPRCGLFGCWPETAVQVAGADAVVKICPVLPTPPVTVHCADFPRYCVPLAGPSAGPWSALEQPAARALDAPSHGWPGVLRGITPEGMPLLGDPTAPVNLLVFQDFSCPHCWRYFGGDLGRVIDDYVLTGRATLKIAFLTFVGRESSANAALATLCAGEQGALWEMADVLFNQGSAAGAAKAYTLDNIETAAAGIGLDGEALRACVAGGRYQAALDAYQALAAELGVNGVPTVLVRQGDTWVKVDRNYAQLGPMIQAAQ